MEPSNGWNSARFVKEHLQEAHQEKLAELTDAELEKNDLFVCRECDDRLFVSLTALNNHVRSNHCQTRSLNNLDLLEQYLLKDLDGNYDSHWKDGLDFLQNIPLDPPPFRQPLTSKIKFRLEQSVCNVFLSTIEAANEALKSVPYHNSINKQHFDSWPIILLPILFEQLVLFPLPKCDSKKQKSISINATSHT